MKECSDQLDTLQIEYQQAGVDINAYHVDNTFFALSTKLGSKLHIVVHNDIGRIERDIQVQKVRGWRIIVATFF